jgi:hypothetical protein
MQSFCVILQADRGALINSYAFKSVGQALHFLATNNPARQRFPNLLEPEFGNCYDDDFSGRSPRDIWASVAAAVYSVLKDQGWESRRVWVLRNRGDSENQLSVEEIALEMGRSKHQIYRILKEVREELESELFRRGLLDPQCMDSQHRDD